MHTRFNSAGCYAVLTGKQSPTLLGILRPPSLRSPLPKPYFSKGCAAYYTDLEWQISTFILNRKDILYPRNCCRCSLTKIVTAILFLSAC